MNKVCDMTYLGLVMVLVQLLGPFVASDYTGVVETSSGPVQGVIASTLNGVNYASFVGIGYAEPPVGNLRFKPPVEIKRWSRTLIATIEGNMCPQRSVSGDVIGVEDCLYLNVFTPVTNLRDTSMVRKSVMVWIHEGSFADGSGNMNTKKPDFLLEKNVIVVSMNYRLGALGFLSLDTPKATGNQGLKDQKLALEWVQKNIEKFGGDPRSVTIFGKDAGAASVGYHVLSDASKDLFHAAISMSGTPLGPRSFVSKAKAAQRGSKLATLVRGRLSRFPWTKEASLQALYAATPTELVQNAFRIDRNSPFVPTVEDPNKATDVFLSDHPIRKYKSGRFNKVPQLLGFTVADQKYVYDTEDFIAIIKTSIKNIEAATGEVPKVLCFFKDQVKLHGHEVGGLRHALEKWAAYAGLDILIKAPMQETQRLLAENIGDNPVYYYDFNIPTDESLRTANGDLSFNDVTYPEDLASIFYIPSSRYNLSASEQLGRVLGSVPTMWANFAKYGNPTPDSLTYDTFGIVWPPSGSNGKGLRIGNEIEVISAPMNILFDPNVAPYNDLFS